MNAVWPKVMGVLNVTPDSFSDGGQFVEVQQAVDRAAQMIEEGADIIDVGGESTRPGARSPSPQEEIGRVMPVVEALHKEMPDVRVSVDTSNPLLMVAAMEHGAALLNDVRAFSAHDMTVVIEMALQRPHVQFSVMHMQGSPDTMQANPSYDQVVTEVGHYLRERVEWLEAKGISRERVLVDPGIGFGKRHQDNLALMGSLPQIAVDGCGLLVGVSRKSMIGTIVGENDPTFRVFGSLGALAPMVLQGVTMVRVHDVKATVDCLSVMRECWPCRIQVPVASSQ